MFFSIMLIDKKTETVYYYIHTGKEVGNEHNESGKGIAVADRT